MGRDTMDDTHPGVDGVAGLPQDTLELLKSSKTRRHLT